MDDNSKYENLEKRLSVWPAFAVAFSGGVDSTLLLAVARTINPENLLAVTISSQFVPKREIDSAKTIAGLMQVRHICIEVDILENKNVVSNTTQRCYHCKKQMFSIIRKTAENMGFNIFCHGVNLDDMKDFRPGLKAAKELGFRSPLKDAGFTKDDIRRLSRHLGLATWNKPSQSCLATRIPYHEQITSENILMVDAAESFLHDLGFVQVRVRCQRKIAIIEVEPQHIDRLSKGDIRKKISEKFQEIGFEHTGIDIDGYKTGSMNAKIKSPAVL